MDNTISSTKNGSSNDLPPGATPVDMRQLFEVIGELYFQIRIQQQTIQRLASSPSSNKVLDSSTM